MLCGWDLKFALLLVCPPCVTSGGAWESTTLNATTLMQCMHNAWLTYTVDWPPAGAALTRHMAALLSDTELKGKPTTLPQNASNLKACFKGVVSGVLHSSSGKGHTAWLTWWMLHVSCAFPLQAEEAMDTDCTDAKSMQSTEAPSNVSTTY